MFALSRRKTFEPGELLPLLNVEAVSKTITARATGRTVIYESSLRVSGGEILGVVGGKFSGRSTLIDLIAGRIVPTSGQIVFNGQDITDLPLEARQQRGIIRVPSTDTLTPDMTVLENVALGGAIRPRPLFSRQGGTSLHEEAKDVLELVGLKEVAHRKTASLQPERQRLLAIAVALAGRPSLLLLDEIHVGDHLCLKDFLALLMRTHKRGIAALIAGVSGSPVMHACDRVVRMRKGRVMTEDRSPRLILPRPAAVRSYLN